MSKPCCSGAIVLVANGLIFAATAQVTIDLADAGRPVSPLLYGIFFEEINHAGDGGLYAELVRNRSFEDTVVPPRCTLKDGKFRTPNGWESPFPMDDPIPGWSLVSPTRTGTTMALEDKDLLNGAQSRCLRMEIKQVEGDRTAIANSGYWGMAVEQGETYALSLLARTSGDLPVQLAATLENEAGKVLAKCTLAGVGPSWKRFTGALTAEAAEKHARLVLSVERPGTLWLDVVSLFPQKTWKHRPNGLRPDLAEMLAALKPAFVRFPGGCFVEGFTLDTAWRWKATVGDIAERPGHWNMWGYRSTGGLGYHELLQMCEDLAAEPLLVVNCGMSCQPRLCELAPMETLDGWIADALDAIEYANGPVGSRWGGLRAAAGHPLPFNLKYLEIGNENSGPAYAQRYVRFYQAIKAKYPAMQLIANCHLNDQPMDIRDDHYYDNPDYFLSHAGLYDALDRNAFKVYVGEYAVVGGHAGKGNLRCAIAEAAFLTGLERNSDVVVMSSYAPLFVNTHDRTWNPDAIVFDAGSCYGTPSYHLQKLLAQNRPDVLLPRTVQCDVQPKEELRGAVGVGTWETQAEFKEFKVLRGHETLYASRPDGGGDAFKTMRGEWKIIDGAWRQSTETQDARAIVGASDWTDYTYSLKARKIAGKEGFLVLFAVRDNRHWFWWNLGGWGNRQHGIEYENNDGRQRLGAGVDGSIETGRWYDLRIELKGSNIRCYLDGRCVHDVTVPALPALLATAGRDRAGEELIIKLVNTTDSPQATQILLRGEKQIASAGERIVLTSSQPADENSFEQPNRVVARKSTLENAARQFQIELDAYAVTVLRLRQEKR